MNRKDFLKNMCSGMCACSGLAFLSHEEVIANESEEEDWRIGFSRRRYTDLMKILHSKLSKEEFNEIIQALGRKHSASISFIKDYEGDLDGYLKELKRRWNEDSIYDQEKGVITVASEERTACFCPLIETEKVPKEVCNCSLGWQKQTFETVLGKNVDVKIVESIIHGGKRCVFEINILA